MHKSLINLYFNKRALALASAYLFILTISYWVSFELRFDFAVTERYEAIRSNTLWWVLVLKFSLLVAFGQLETVLAFFRLKDAMRLFMALVVAAVVLVLSWYQFDGKEIAPRAVILSDLQFSFLALVALRLTFRLKASTGLSDWLNVGQQENVLIVGAGEVGAALSVELMSKGRLGMRPVAFLDDDETKHGRYIHGILIAGKVEDLAAVAKRCKATKVVIAFPSASIKRVKAASKCARDAGLKVDIVPALSDLVSGRAELSQIRPVQLEDLLGREAVDLNNEEIRAMLSGKKVLITGAGGSIGKELVRQVAEHEPSALMCIDQAELAIFNLREYVFNSLEVDLKAETRVLDICEQSSISRLLEEFQPQVIFHAAAHKHVNLMEAQPEEALKNNTIGTIGLARLASQFGVENFVFISTDKAINPTSVMGASKRLAELALAEQQKAAGNQTRFISVRFGNVIGSSGSVIPIFQKQISEGGPLTVTDSEVTRFFMTAKEAVGLVLQSASQGEGGEVFVLDMGKSMKILDIAKQMIVLAGLREGVDITIDIIGLRAGEKRFEEVQHLSETLHPTTHSRILRFIGSGEASVPAENLEERLKSQISLGDPAAIRDLMKAMLPEYQPYEVE